MKVSQSCSTLQHHGLYSPRNSPGQTTGVGSLTLLQGIFSIQGLNPGLLHCRQILYKLSHQASPRILEWVAFPFSRGSSQPRDRTQVSHIASRFFTCWTTRDSLLSQSGTLHVHPHLGHQHILFHLQILVLGTQPSALTLTWNTLSLLLSLHSSSSLFPHHPLWSPHSGFLLSSKLQFRFTSSDKPGLASLPHPKQPHSLQPLYLILMTWNLTHMPLHLSSVTHWLFGLEQVSLLNPRYLIYRLKLINKNFLIGLPWGLNF